MRKFALVLPLMAAVTVFTGCERSVSYSKDVKPILGKYCGDCHTPGGQGHTASGLDLGSYQGLMKGTKFGPVVKPKDSFTSALVMLVEGRADPSIKMPHGVAAGPADEAKLPSAEEIATLKLWIDQGAQNN